MLQGEPDKGNLPSDVLTDLDWTNVAAAASLLLLNVLLSLRFKLGLEAAIIVSALRCYVQLSVMGKVLSPVFGNGDNPLVVFGMTAVLILLGSSEALSKSKYVFDGLIPVVLVSMLASASVTMAVGMNFAVHPQPWFSARVFIPTLGMVLGNGISGVALGMRSCLTALKEQGDMTELRLAFGASRAEAAVPVIRESLRTALLPALNSMSVMGLISIPGQMTGQILAGAPIDSAVHFQQIVMYMIVSSTAIAVLLAVLLTTLIIIDDKLRVRSDRISLPTPSRVTVLASATAASLANGWRRVFCLTKPSTASRTSAWRRKRQQQPVSEQTPLLSPST
ncbi:hypothetical protein BC828DRAFT_380066 [Blastocladiella britannica]|nr:hypothetical protein BC828DRAFT_380066 [Blastocladiella britannica]